MKKTIDAKEVNVMSSVRYEAGRAGRPILRISRRRGG